MQSPLALEDGTCQECGKPNLVMQTGKADESMWATPSLCGSCHLRNARYNSERQCSLGRGRGRRPREWGCGQSHGMRVGAVPAGTEGVQGGLGGGACDTMQEMPGTTGWEPNPFVTLMSWREQGGCGGYGTVMKPPVGMEPVGCMWGTDGWNILLKTPPQTLISGAQARSLNPLSIGTLIETP
jgi:hypothetical protein